LTGHEILDSENAEFAVNEGKFTGGWVGRLRFLSLKVGIYAAGSGGIRLRNFTYKAL